jgi:hypothetical protein
VIRGLALLAVLVGAACTEVSTDPNAVVAVRFDGSPYPSIVALDSLRDSLGKLQPLTATGLNYKGDAVLGATFAFSSSDTNLRVFDDGNVYAIRRKTDGVPAKVYATAASLQSVPDSLFVVQRADSIKAVKQVDTALFTPGVGAATATGSPTFQVFGDTAVGKPKATVPAWLVSLQLRYKEPRLRSPTRRSHSPSKRLARARIPFARRESSIRLTRAASRVTASSCATVVRRGQRLPARDDSSA